MSRYLYTCTADTATLQTLSPKHVSFSPHKSCNNIASFPNAIINTPHLASHILPFISPSLFTASSALLKLLWL